MTSKIKVLFSLMVAIILCATSVSSLACTAIYVGSDLTADGSTIFARSEDISNSYNKVFYVSPAGNHTAGEVYNGCYGFTYTFTKDSYEYTAFADDVGQGYCPDCGGDHKHTPYEAGGTNEMGVTVSATETIGCSDAMYAADPYVDTGIEEAEIPTVILSEAATAKEGVDLILNIFDTAGSAGGAGFFVADNNETWYIEVTTGHQYIAIKCSSTLVFSEPNMAIIGLIDLDDTDNVIASAGIIETAKTADTFVGDEEANTIDYLASYNGDQTANGRMVDALNFFNAEYTSEEPAAADYAISNVDAEGNIVPMYTNIKLDRAFTVADVVDYYHIPGIGSSRNLETHIFQIFDEDSITDTVEWVSMDNAALSVFVPYYPMLTTDTYAAYKVSTPAAEFVTEEPAEGIYYATTGRQYIDGERVTVEGFKIIPANWADSYYWTFDALSNLYEFGTLTDDQKANIDTTLAAVQADVYADFAEMQTAVAAAATPEEAAQIATDMSAATAAEAHAAGVELVNSIK